MPPRRIPTRSSKRTNARVLADRATVSSVLGRRTEPTCRQANLLAGVACQPAAPLPAALRTLRLCEIVAATPASATSTEFGGRIVGDGYNQRFKLETSINSAVGQERVYRSSNTDREDTMCVSRHDQA